MVWQHWSLVQSQHTQGLGYRQEPHKYWRDGRMSCLSGINQRWETYSSYSKRDLFPLFKSSNSSLRPKWALLSSENLPLFEDTALSQLQLLDNNNASDKSGLCEMRQSSSHKPDVCFSATTELFLLLLGDRHDTEAVVLDQPWMLSHGHTVEVSKDFSHAAKVCFFRRPQSF